MRGVILVAHGSQKESSNNEVLALADRLNKKKPFHLTAIKPAFLEFAHPDIPTAVKEMIDAHCSVIDIYPFFLNAGKHVSADIPQTIERLRKLYPEVELRILPHFGGSSKITDMILNDLEDIS